MNIYFQLMAKSDNPAEAIAEAKKIAELVDVCPLGVEVKVCGLHETIAVVSKDGELSFPSKRIKPAK